ncbi:MAG TPA: arsenate reductase family protein [Pyrinomonadaceae bacterium]
MSKNITFYWSETCSTCQKAKNFLERHGIKNYEKRDIKENPLSRDEVVKLSAIIGGADNLFSRRAVKYREMKLNERELAAPEMIDLMASEYTFLKRPVLVINDKAIAGFFEKQFEDFIYKNYFNK